MTTTDFVARFYIARYRQRGEQRSVSSPHYRPDPLLTAWATWEDVRDCFAREVADDVVNGYEHLAKEDAERYRLAVERMNRARTRYAAAYKAKRAASLNESEVSR